MQTSNWYCIQDLYIMFFLVENRRMILLYYVSLLYYSNIGGNQKYVMLSIYQNEKKKY